MSVRVRFVPLAVAALVALWMVSSGAPQQTSAEALPFRLLAPMVAADSVEPDVLSGEIETRHTSSYTDATTPDLPVFFVVGEVLNGRPNAVERVQLSAKFYDGAGQRVDVDGDVTYADLEVIPSGGDSPFSFAIVNPPSPIASYTIDVTGSVDPAQQPVVTGLVAVVDSTQVQETVLVATGRVRNDSTFTWQSVVVLVAYYDASGRVVRTDLTFPDTDTLLPNDEAEFQSFVNTEGVTIVSQRAWVRATR